MLQLLIILATIASFTDLQVSSRPNAYIYSIDRRAHRNQSPTLDTSNKIFDLNFAVSPSHPTPHSLELHNSQGMKLTFASVSRKGNSEAYCLNTSKPPSLSTAST